MNLEEIYTQFPRSQKYDPQWMVEDQMGPNVVWLAEALQKENITLKPGDLLSLGSFSPLLPPKAGLQVQANYQGLPAAQPVRVTFK